jgi:hypothetical protein
MRTPKPSEELFRQVVTSGLASVLASPPPTEFGRTVTQRLKTRGRQTASTLNRLMDERIGSSYAEFSQLYDGSALMPGWQSEAFKIQVSSTVIELLKAADAELSTVAT